MIYSQFYTEGQIPCQKDCLPLPGLQSPPNMGSTLNGKHLPLQLPPTEEESKSPEKVHRSIMLNVQVLKHKLLMNLVPEYNIHVTNTQKYTYQHGVALKTFSFRVATYHSPTNSLIFP